MEIVLSGDAIENFRKSLCDDGRRPLTAKAYCGDLNTFLNLTEMESISREDFETYAKNYLNGRRDTASANSTIRRITAFKMFARWAWKFEDCLATYKAPTPAVPIPHPLPGGMSDIRRMLAVCESVDHRALVALQGFWALRVSEARAVTATHFNEAEMTLRINGKGNKYRDLPVIADWFAVVLDSYQRALLDGGPLVRLSDAGARLAIKRIAMKAGIQKDIASHDLRATSLTDLYDKTKNIRLVQQFAGHASVEQTQVYIDVPMTSMRAAASML